MDFEVIIVKEFYDRESVRADKDYIYLFTDNLMRSSGRNPIKEINSYTAQRAGIQLYYPNVTQAVIRGLDNAYPITTMRDCYKTPLDNVRIDQLDELWEFEVNNILSELSTGRYKGIKVFDAEFGNGTYSKLKSTYPAAYELLSKKLLKLKIINGFHLSTITNNG